MTELTDRQELEKIVNDAVRTAMDCIGMPEQEFERLRGWKFLAPTFGYKDIFIRYSGVTEFLAVHVYVNPVDCPVREGEPWTTTPDVGGFFLVPLHLADEGRKQYDNPGVRDMVKAKVGASAARLAAAVAGRIEAGPPWTAEQCPTCHGVGLLGCDRDTATPRTYTRNPDGSVTMTDGGTVPSLPHHMTDEMKEKMRNYLEKCPVVGEPTTITLVEYGERRTVGTRDEAGDWSFGERKFVPNRLQIKPKTIRNLILGGALGGLIGGSIGIAATEAALRIWGG